MSAVLTLAGISWDPGLRGILIVAVAFIILPGSVYLLVGTNTGFRLGLLITLSALFGWLVILGTIWTLYGKGVADQARLPTWEVVEVHKGPISDASTPQARNLKVWHSLPESDTARGEAQASASEAVVGEEADKPFKEDTDFVVLSAYDLGGKRYGPAGLDFRPFNVFHKPHYAVVQVQAVKPVETEAGGTPPTPEADTTKPVISVVMKRDLGNVRQRPLLFTLFFLILFLWTVWGLHRRDKLSIRHRAEAPAPT